MLPTVTNEGQGQQPVGEEPLFDWLSVEVKNKFMEMWRLKQWKTDVLYWKGLREVDVNGRGWLETLNMELKKNLTRDISMLQKMDKGFKIFKKFNNVTREDIVRAQEMVF